MKVEKFNIAEIAQGFLQAYLWVNEDIDEELKDKNFTVFDLSEQQTTLVINGLRNWTTKYESLLSCYTDDEAQLGHDAYMSASGNGDGFMTYTSDPNKELLHQAAKELEGLALYSELFY